jgi:hypothetical protein
MHPKTRLLHNIAATSALSDMSKFFMLILLLLSAAISQAQISFLQPYEGNWKGELEIIGSRRQVQRVTMQMEIKKLSDSLWLWKTTYASEKPVTKNYTVRLQNEEEGKYMLDEGDGILIHMNRLGEKLYALFDVEGSILSCTYEIKEGILFYEIVSGSSKPASNSKTKDGVHAVNSYAMRFLQRAVLKKQP